MMIRELLDTQGIAHPETGRVVLEGLPVKLTHPLSPCLDALLRVDRHLWSLDWLDHDYYQLRQLTVPNT